MRDLFAISVLFALDFGALSWAFRNRHAFGADFMALFAGLGLIWLPFILVYLYVPPRWDEVCGVVLILALLTLMIVPALHHS